ncbi:MAG: N-acetylmuramoyl-L-alanine amidase, partial [Candidatus Taylorbacteria bacterium]
MRKKWQLLLVTNLALSLLCGSVAAAATATEKYKMPEIKVFQLQERQVTAVAVENRIPGQGIEDVSGYRLEPVFTEKRSANQLEVVLSNVNTEIRETPAGSLVAMENLGTDQVRFSLKGAEAAAATIATVRRKTVKGRDGTIRMRTYLVFNIPRGPKKEIPTVVLDAGHGGEYSGAVKNFIHEKDIDLDITLRTARLFEGKGWNVILTRREDVEPSLLDRADAANIVGADVFISIHNNSLPEEKIPFSREYGTTVLYNSSAVRPAYDLAVMAQDELVGALGTQREVMQDRPRLVVLNSTWVPAILTEGIMMTNPANAKMVLDRVQRQRMAEAIFKATETWRGRKALAASKTAPVQAAIQLEAQSPAGAGNSSANTANHGIVAARDGWIYYLRKADSLFGEKEETLWRFRPDRLMSDQLVAAVETWDLNLAGEWIYYVNWS